MTKIHLIAALALLNTVISCKNEKKDQVLETKEITFSKEGELSLFSLSDSIPKLIKKIDIEIADDDYQIQTGLMYRESMKNDQGMLFVFPDEEPHSFYMKNTRFPLDIIFIDSKHKVVSIQKNAQPLDESSLPSEGPAQYVLEINAKLSDQWNLKAGDSISFTKM
ncbi:DUF192 domain-containing protein [Aquimarina algicola]|uniref:DUF192 domain-containing protein n=1 Tax=Aquimarina algicola TaxID=2589995 RepID=A0A504IZZ6_9FLAO|nr:DUF192 domain-containing protein [Aquimarina algicola]TPN81722.1 DUF192 domain-containing protein [Aquimarina algicola]